MEELSPVLQPKVFRSSRYIMHKAEQTADTVLEKIPHFIFDEHKFSCAS